MEADDEWEDHLIVSYTPQQGSEMTMTEHQVERIIANPKLEMAPVTDKPSGEVKLVQQSVEKLMAWLPTNIYQTIGGLTSDKVNSRHKYWNFFCRSIRSDGLVTAVGHHVFHQTQTGEWQMFDEPGDSKYSGDIRFVLQIGRA